MARCEDCLHEKVCVIKAFPDAFENTEWVKEPCDHFKTDDVAPRAEWISVEERLPNNLELVVALDSQGTMFTVRYLDFVHGQYAWCSFQNHTGVITHWMPLPEPPEGG